MAAVTYVDGVTKECAKELNLDMNHLTPSDIDCLTACILKKKVVVSKNRVCTLVFKNNRKFDYTSIVLSISFTFNVLMHCNNLFQ